MAKDILLYGTISEASAMFFNEQIEEAYEDDPETEFTLRVNCEGGSPDYGMSIIEKINELDGKISIKVGAQAHSMALFMLAYIDTSKAECIDTTQAVLHRAAYSNWIENSVSFNGSIYQQMMVKTNKDLEKAFRAKADIELLEALPQFKDKDITLKDIFSTDSRLEVLLSASDLKKIGLVSKVNKITPTRQLQMAAQMDKFKKCASLSDFRVAAKFEETVIETELTKNENMNLSELKEKHFAVYAEAIQAGIAIERDRVEGIMVFNEIDPAGVKAAIESGKPLSSKQSSEFALKNFNLNALKNIEADSVKGDLTTDEIEVKEKPEKQTEKEAFEASVQAKLNLKK